MAHQEQHDGGTDSRLGTAFSTFTMLGDTMQKPLSTMLFLSRTLKRLRVYYQKYGVYATSV